jgi:hypothetical protein
MPPFRAPSQPRRRADISLRSTRSSPRQIAAALFVFDAAQSLRLPLTSACAELSDQSMLPVSDTSSPQDSDAASTTDAQSSLTEEATSIVQSD